FSLLEACEQFPDLKLKIDNADEDVKRLWNMSLRLEDLTRNVGKHAAGVLIAPGKLTDFCPLYVADGMQTAQLDKDDVELVGLVKFDCLGLRNLTIIQESLEHIKELYQKDIKLSQYDFDDPKTYQLLQRGNTSAIFQLESPGMKRVLVKLEPDRFEDIIALLALYRPGPLGSGMVDDFIRRKKGIDVPNYFHDKLKSCLESTYGVIVYQEQVMQISQIIGGYTLGGADLLRRAMGKKKPEEMAKHKGIFVDGAIVNGYTKELAIELFDLMAKFAEYGFNKSHSAAYAMISYHTAYLKAHYASCFMAATLSSELHNTDKIYELYQDCLTNKITLLSPNINRSNYRFIAMSDHEIRYGLGAIKGIGQNVVELIVNEKLTNGLYKGFVDFCMRVDKKVINKKTLEGLVKAGCFDCFDKNRAKYYSAIADILSGQNKNIIDENQASLFDHNIMIEVEAENSLEYSEYLPDICDWTLKEMLQMEKSALGYYFSASLFDQYKELVKKLGIEPLSTYSLENEEMLEIANSRSREKRLVLVCGIIQNIGYRALKKGGKVYFINIEDDVSDFEFVIFNDDYEKYKDLLKVDSFVFVEGELIYDSFREQIKITARSVYNLDDILIDKIKQVTLYIDNNVNESQLGVLFSEQGNVRVIVHYSNLVAYCKLEFGSKYKFVISYENMLKLSDVIGKDAWSIVI
ncbi:MAG: DNA polymerase III subunit alpha, partial [Burkholderiales bacterium]|nr:DNA polymerase III subunit alpha [Burkholderiales bacterium]